ncbi:MAG TPA: hypothetical protein VIF84_07375 [Candidatus Limnocylindrales bacterium]
MARIAVVADDLIWASRLTDAVRRTGGQPVALAGAAADAASVAGCVGALVDVALVTADPMTVIAAVHAGGVPILAVADHDDVELRKRALAAGADRVLAYRKLYEDGPGVISSWLARTAGAT